MTTMTIKFNEKTKLYTDDEENEYYVHQTGPHHFEVAKFHDGGSQPSEVYEVVDTRYGFVCNCPGYRRGQTSKHINLVKDWIRRGRPIPTAFEDTGFKVAME